MEEGGFDFADAPDVVVEDGPDVEEASSEDGGEYSAPSSASSSGSAKSKSKSAPAGRAKSAPPVKKAASRGGPPKRSFKGSPGAAAGNYIVSPKSKFTIQVRKRDPKTGDMVYNKEYSKLVESLGMEEVSAQKRYTTKEAADEAAKAQRAANKKSGRTASGAVKKTLYYFNMSTSRVGTKFQPGSSHPEGFETKLEASNWGYTHGLVNGRVKELTAKELGQGFLIHRPVQKPRGKLKDQDGIENARWTMEMRGKVPIFKKWIGNDGKPTKHQVDFLAGAAAVEGGGKVKLPKLYDIKEKLKMAEDKSESAKAERGSTKTEDNVREKAKEARAAGVKKETIDKILARTKRTAGQRWSDLDISMNRDRAVGGWFARKGENVDGNFEEAPKARKNRMFYADGRVTAAGVKFAREALKKMEKTVPAVKDMTPERVRAALEQARDAKILTFWEE